MRLIRGLYNLRHQPRGNVVTIGNFDGVHLGHQALLAKVKQFAKQHNLSSLVMTFEPQPAEFFMKNQFVVPRLTRLREKFHLLEQSGLDQTLVLSFNRQLAGLPAEQFAQIILSTKINARHVLIGDDFRFGHKRQGDFALLKYIGEQCGFTVEAMPSVLVQGERVSSTRIRQALQVADHRLAETLLGHPYTMEGRVVHGDKLGRSIGFPTANIYLHRRATPVQGIYIVRMHGLGNRAIPGVANVGTRPTVGGTRSLLEVYLFNFNQEIYGRYVRVEFIEKLRDEERYANLTLLKAQIEKDAKQAKLFFEMRGEL